MNDHSTDLTRGVVTFAVGPSWALLPTAREVRLMRAPGASPAGSAVVIACVAASVGEAPNLHDRIAVTVRRTEALALELPFPRDAWAMTLRGFYCGKDADLHWFALYEADKVPSSYRPTVVLSCKPTLVGHAADPDRAVVVPAASRLLQRPDGYVAVRRAAVFPTRAMKPCLLVAAEVDGDPGESGLSLFPGLVNVTLMPSVVEALDVVLRGFATGERWIAEVIGTARTTAGRAVVIFYAQRTYGEVDPDLARTYVRECLDGRLGVLEEVPGGAVCALPLPERLPAVPARPDLHPGAHDPPRRPEDFDDTPHPSPETPPSVPFAVSEAPEAVPLGLPPLDVLLGAPAWVVALQRCAVHVTARVDVDGVTITVDGEARGGCGDAPWTYERVAASSIGTAARPWYPVDGEGRILPRPPRRLPLELRRDGEVVAEIPVSMTDAEIVAAVRAAQR